MKQPCCYFVPLPSSSSVFFSSTNKTFIKKLSNITQYHQNYQILLNITQSIIKIIKYYSDLYEIFFMITYFSIKLAP